MAPETLARGFGQSWRDHVGIDITGGSSAMDYQEHARTYQGFVKSARIGVGLCALALVLMALFLL